MNVVAGHVKFANFYQEYGTRLSTVVHICHLAYFFACMG